jgi:hypothetical protein
VFETLGNLGDFVGGIAVVVTLVYLAVQVRQNTRSLDATSRQQVVDSYRTVNRLLIDPATARKFSTGLVSFPDLPFEERSTFAAVASEIGLFFQCAFALHDSGQLEDETYHAYLDWTAAVLATPGGQTWWQDARNVWSKRTAEALDARLARGGLIDVCALPAYRLDPSTPSGRTEDSR